MAVVAEGVEERHSRGCRARTSGRCNCKPSYQVTVYDGRAQRRIHKTFRTLTEAKAWRQDAAGALRAGTMRASDGRTVRDVADRWLADAREGVVRNRSGDRYKPSAIRAYDFALRRRVYPVLGDKQFAQLRRRDVQAFVDALQAADEDGKALSPSSILGAILPLKAIYRRATSRGEVAVNPTTGLEMPAIRGRRDRIVSPAHAATLLEALEPADRPVWAAALYAGLRYGELRALRWDDVSLLDGVIDVCRGWDYVEGEITPKSRTGVRKVPIPEVLAGFLETLAAAAGFEGLVFGADGKPFDGRPLLDRSREAWTARDLDGLTLHECRHTYASFMIAAGVNAKALSTYLGHANIAITFDRYGHLMPGNEAQAAGLLDVFLAAGTAG